MNRDEWCIALATKPSIRVLYWTIVGVVCVLWVLLFGMLTNYLGVWEQLRLVNFIVGVVIGSASLTLFREWRDEGRNLLIEEEKDAFDEA